jgi:serine/threonine protein kinase
MPTDRETGAVHPGRLIDELCDGFEVGWLTGSPLLLEGVVASAPEPLRPELFRELLAVEGEYRAKALRPITPDEARHRFAGLGPWAETVIREIFAGTGSWAAPVPQLEGAVAPSTRACVGKYELIAKLGSGAHGVVFKARHPELDRLCAVKVLFPPQVQTAVSLERFRRVAARFRREMVALARLSHPNVIRATDGGESGRSLFLVMEFVEGADLGRVMKDAGRLAAADACEATRQAAEGLAYIERNGMVHRDVKPSNLLLGRDGVVRILDLGLARLAAMTPGDWATETGALMGTPDFISPEQARGVRDIDIRADVYSLGCTLYTFLTGSPPFARPEFENPYKKFQAHNEAPVPALAPACPNLPPGLEDLVLWMLQKDPAKRPESPAVLAQAIAPFCAGHNLAQLAPHTQAEPLDPPTRTGNEHQAGVASVLRPIPQVTTLTQEVKQRSWTIGIASLIALAAIVGGAIWFATRPHPNEQGTQATQPGPDRTNPFGQQEPERAFRPGVWTELLDREPTILARPQLAKDFSCNLEPVGTSGTKRLVVTCGGTGRALLRLGEVNAPAFDMKVTLSQAPWVGGVGVLVRGRADQNAHGLFTTFDGFLLDPFDNQTPAPATMQRGIIRAYPDLQTVPDWQRRAILPRPRGDQHTLTVRLGQRGPQFVSFDEQLIAGGLLDPFPGEIPRLGAGGSVGVLVEHSHAVFDSIQVRIPLLGENP